MTPVKVEKNLMSSINVSQITDEEGISHQDVLMTDDSRRLSTILAAIDPKVILTKELLQVKSLDFKMEIILTIFIFPLVYNLYICSYMHI